MRPKGYVNSQAASVLVVICFAIGILLGIGLERTKDHDITLAEEEAGQYEPLGPSITTATVTFQDHIVDVGTVIQNVNTGGVSIVTDIVESFSGKEVYILDGEDRWQESLIREHWRELPAE